DANAEGASFFSRYLAGAVRELGVARRANRHRARQPRGAVHHVADAALEIGGREQRHLRLALQPVEQRRRDVGIAFARRATARARTDVASTAVASTARGKGMRKSYLMSLSPDSPTSEHKAQAPRSIGCFVVTVSDTRTEANDTSGRAIGELLSAAGHRVVGRAIVKDDPDLVRGAIERQLAHPDVQVLITTGGTGITSRDSTYE